ncbi:ATP-binding protein [Pedobacter frigoris]|uniref:histidine kinase n=1 Tax=Pedobacter frigoris TaxID=2571272 RepID=A0A4V5P2L6_9SPHI|nr:ATP-binding protein [Pedobacter frigoris]TKC08882.1 response regulator [Pedobacter frigoris]
MRINVTVVMVWLMGIFWILSILLFVLQGVQQWNIYVYNFSLVLNFTLLIFIQYYFFQTFRKTSHSEQKLTAQLELAEKTVTASTNFLATMSHELRTPLNAVIGMTNILLHDEPRPQQKENLEILHFSADSLMRTINDILSFNRLDSGMEQLEQTDFRLDTLLGHIYNALKPRVSDSGVQFILDVDQKIAGKYIQGDQNRLTQVFFNLAGNAIKFTEKGFVKISAVVVAQEAGFIRIKFVIEDSGVGIPELQKDKLFEPYFRAAHHSAGQFKGTGLGLAIARRLIDLQGGVLRFHSQENVGSVFSFELSFAERIPKALVQSDVRQNPTDEIGELQILVAEDNPVNVLVLQRTLARWGLTVDVVENGHAAVEALALKSYDLIFMDINMPVMGGFEAARLIREMPDPVKSNVCIIALTASVGMSVEIHQEFRYLDDFLLKPFTPVQLKGKLEQVSRMKQII